MVPGRSLKTALGICSKLSIPHNDDVDGRRRRQRPSITLALLLHPFEITLCQFVKLSSKML